ncbi:MAG: class I SAM-dependent methyltransferase [Tannerella sp.]|jgi:2-polyprenyl-3-methyl-5-hydroxy-6-metoxy-1,4-benzoquinol methylase|nr:class I SAM-dependent methyltransferase [Tannerella sp.]
MKEFHYSGTETLETMANAKRYNAFLEKLVTGYIPCSGKILDIGAGIGTFAQKIRSKGFNVHCIEPDYSQRKQIEKMGLPVSDSVEDTEDGSVDYIYSLNVLEHIENDMETMTLWAKKLKPGGKILVYVPAFNILYSSMDKSVGHYRRYRKKTLAERFRNVGLEIEKAKYVDSAGFFVSLLYKLMNSDGKINNRLLIFYDRIIFPVSRICDFFCSGLFGKNVYAAGKKIKQ